MAEKLTPYQTQERLRENLLAELRLFPAILGKLEVWLAARRQALLEGVLADGGLENARGKSEMLQELMGLVASARPEPKGENEDG